MRRQHPVAILLLVLALTGCGPIARLNVGLKQSGSDILFGRPPASPAPVAPPLNIEPFPNFPAPLEQAPVVAVPPTATPLPRPNPCPTASPVAFPELDARPTPSGVPVAAIYPFRFTSVTTLNPGGVGEKVVTRVGDGTREIREVSPVATDGSYTYKVVETFSGMVTTTTYKVYPVGPAPALPGAPVTPAAGLYLQEQNQGGSDFRPNPPVLLMPFPGQSGTSFQGGGTDPTNGPTTMTIDPQGGTVVDRAHVDACGVVLDSWQVDIAGRVANARGAGLAQTIKLSLRIATQYGAFSVMDHLVLDGTDQVSGQPLRYDVSATISRKPENSH